ncbi:7TM-DISM domain-containing protein [Sphaerospermopsis torques-reginae]|uniref:histidine kinase n=1 Tax=Sphaerospermopsis torques-reginae ITEP-024 TaxID=984208 RepID=A0ABX8WTV7_9CYAN|nr:7TM-DISM domain-containing protein [Sphaerospermopsis torques-reginae]QYX29814.1 PAS domain S-box protein [Sphaerospermopsis torques-reginae ITEP-024]
MLGYLLVWEIYLPVKATNSSLTNTVVLNDEQGKYQLGKYLEILVDPSQKLTIADVTQPQQKFTPSQSDIPNMGFSRAATWARVKLRNESNITSEWYLQGGPNNIDQVELYIPQGNSWIKKQIGRKLPFSGRELRDSNLVFVLPLAMGEEKKEEKTIYLRFTSQGTIAMNVILWQPVTYYQNNLTQQFLIGGFYGILLIIIGINLLLVLLLKDIIYRYHVVSLIALTANYFIRDGLAFEYLWPKFPEWNISIMLISAGIALASASSFYISFLPVRLYSRQLYTLMNWVRWICVGYTLIACFLPFSKTIIAGLLLVIIVCGLVNYACLYTWHKGFMPARFAILEWGCILLNTSIWCLKAFALLPANILTEDLHRLGLIGLASFVGLALADNINLIKTERNKLQSEQKKLALIVEKSSEFISINNLNGEMVFINDAGMQMIGLNTENALIEGNIWDYFCQDDRYLFPSNIFPTVLKSGYWEGELTLVNGKTREEIYTISSFFLIKDQQTGEATALASIIRDISQLKKAEQEILETLEKEKAVSEMRSRFIAMASHEIRTPLAIISSSTGILQTFGDRLNAEKKYKHLNTIQETIKRMTQLLDDVLMINRVEAEKMEFKPQASDIIAFCHRLKEETEITTTKHIIDLSYNLDEQMADGSLIVQFDQKLLQQILTNLLTNAIKYSPENNLVKFTLTRENEQLVFTITDHGIGILEADKVKLFAPFFRGSNVGNISGTGLGLSIVKKCLDLHQGKISVDSRQGEGTTFTVSIPYLKG